MEKKLSIVERAILINQNKNFLKIDSENALSYEFNIEALENGFIGVYRNVYSGIKPENELINLEECDETEYILGMFEQIEQVINSLEPYEQEELNKDLLLFNGFDLNNDKHYSYANFIINSGIRFEYFKGRKMNSHTQSTIIMYRRMLAKYREILRNTNGGIDFENLKEIQDSALK